MKKTSKILTALTLLAAVCGGGFYYTQLYPDHKDISRLETLIHQRQFYDDKLAKAELDIFPTDRLKQLAEKNYPIAQYELGRYYRKEKNEEEAKKWFSRAANQNFAPAYRALSYTYDAESYEEKTFLAKAASLGDVVAKYYEASDNDNIPALEELAKMGYLDAQARLIELYFDDKDSQSWEKAFYWADRYYQNIKKYNTDYINRYNYKKLAILYYLGIGTPPDIAKAEKILKEYIALLENSALDQYDKEAFKDIEHLKMALVAEKDNVTDKVAQAKIQQLSNELQANNGAERFFKQANIFLDMVPKEKKEEFGQLIQLVIFNNTKDYFGISCDMGSQAGCDKYAELNSK